MLSEETKTKLLQQVRSWNADGNVGDTIAQHVLNIAMTEPQSEHEVRTYCENNMLSTALVEWYNKFLDYLEAHTADEKPEKILPDDVVETARKFRDALNIFLEQYDGK